VLDYIIPLYQSSKLGHVHLFQQKFPICNFMKILPEKVELIHADRRTDGRTWSNY